MRRVVTAMRGSPIAIYPAVSSQAVTCHPVSDYYYRYVCRLISTSDELRNVLVVVVHSWTSESPNYPRAGSLTVRIEQVRLT
jgi:hypothetical protein